MVSITEFLSIWLSGFSIGGAVMFYCYRKFSKKDE